MPTPTAPTLTRVPLTATPRARRSSIARAAVMAMSAVSASAARRATAPAVPYTNVTRWPLSAPKRSAMAASGACTPRGQSTVISPAAAETAVASVKRTAAARRRILVAAGAVDDLQQRTSGEEALEVVAPELGHQRVALRVQPADVRQDDDAGRGPERVLGGQ